MPSRTSTTSSPACAASLRASKGGSVEAPAQPADAGPRRLSSDAVFAGAVEVLICHHGTDYRLRQTTLGKLILTK